MALKHDAQGFLVGDPIDIGRALAVWDEIHEDVRAIRRAITKAGTMPAPEQSARGPAVMAHPAPALPMAHPAPALPMAHPAPALPMAHPAPAQRDADQVPALLRKPAIPQTGGAGGNANRRDAQATAATSQAVAAVRTANQVVQKAVAKPVARDDRGRFVRGSGGKGRVSGAPGAGGGSGEDGNGEAGVVRSIADRIVGAVKESGTGMEEADPAIKAFNEVAQPMARGYELMTGGNKDKRQERWLRRIYTSLTGFRKDETVFNKAANKSLKNLEAKPEGGEGGNGGFWGTILSAIMGIGPAILAGIGALLSKIPFFGPKIGGAGAGGVGTGAAGAAGGAAKAGGGIFKGALKKIPLLGALLAVGGAAADIYGSENDDKLSRREKDKNAGKAVGGAGGTIAGMAAGAAAGAFAGPIGMAIGGMVGAFLGDQAGQIIGDTVGGWVSDLRAADIPGKISNAWNEVKVTALGTWDWIKTGWDSVAGTLQNGWDATMTAFSAVGDTIKKAWGGFVDTAKAGWESVSGVFASAYEGLKSIPVIGPAIQAVEDAAKKTAAAASAAAAAAKQKAVEVGTKAVEKGKEVAQATKEKAVEVGTRAVEGVKAGAEYLGNNTTIGKGVVKAWEGAKTAGNWVLGQTSKLFESGKGGSGAVSSGKGDHGGASYGTYQLSSSQGTLQQFLKSSKYGDQFAGLQPGTPEFNAKWKEVAKADPEFGSAQHDFIKRTHFDPQMVKLAKGGIDLSGRGAAVQDAVWSTSVQFGGKSSLIEKALAGRDVSKLSDADIVSAIQDYKIANNDNLFSKSDDNVRAGTAKRAVEEKKRLLALADQDASANAGVKDAMGGGTQTVQAGQVTYPPKSPVEVATASIPKPPALVATASLTNVQTAHLTMPPAVSPPSVQTFNDAPPVVDTLASNSGSASKKPAAATVAAPDAGQDLRDRRIAHIVTGGLSSA